MAKQVSGEFGLPTPRLLAAARALAGLSQVQLAAEAGINKSIVSRYEAGLTTMRAVSFERIIRVLRAHGIRFLGATPRIAMGVVLERQEPVEEGGEGNPSNSTTVS